MILDGRPYIYVWEDENSYMQSTRSVSTSLNQLKWHKSQFQKKKKKKKAWNFNTLKLGFNIQSPKHVIISTNNITAGSGW